MENPQTKAALRHVIVQRQANKTKNTENWKISTDPIEKPGLTQVLANVGHNGWFRSTCLDHFCLIFAF